MSAVSESLRRTNAMLIKEFIQLRRDRISFAMIIMFASGDGEFNAPSPKRPQ